MTTSRTDYGTGRAHREGCRRRFGTRDDPPHGTADDGHGRRESVCGGLRGAQRLGGSEHGFRTSPTIEVTAGEPRLPGRVALSSKHAEGDLVLVVVVVNLQGGAVQVQGGRDAEHDVLVQAVAAGDGVAEFRFGVDGLHFPPAEGQHVGFKWADQGLCREAVYVQSDYQLVLCGRYRLAIHA